MPTLPNDRFWDLSVAQADHGGSKIDSRSPYFQCAFPVAERKYCLNSFSDMWFFAVFRGWNDSNRYQFGTGDIL
jgi:hypothetical protein